jgi:predicted transcriptional regulator
MTTAFVVRLNKKQAAGLASSALKRSTTRSAILRAALDKYLVENNKPEQGVGWAEHFERLEKHGRKVDSKFVDEVIKASRKREFP